MGLGGLVIIIICLYVIFQIILIWSYQEDDVEGDGGGGTGGEGDVGGYDGGYGGYGYTTMSVTSKRKSSIEEPNFYKRASS